MLYVIPYSVLDNCFKPYLCKKVLPNITFVFSLFIFIYKPKSLKLVDNILISWLISDDGPWFEKFSNQFDIYKNNRELLMRILNNMVTCQSDNIVFSKNLLDTWDEKSKEFFLNEYISTFIGLNGENIGLKIEKNILNFDNKFNLFKVL